jgi:hypothetical protein
MDDADQIYWSDQTMGKIQRSYPDGSNVVDVLTGLTDPYGVAVDRAGGKLYWSEGGTLDDKIYRANLDGTGVELLISGLSDPRDIEIDPAGGKIYWVENGARSINRANLDGTAPEELFNGLSNAKGLGLDLSAGKVYWTDQGAGKIQRANLDGSGPEDVLTGLPTGALQGPRDIGIDAAGGKLYWTDAGGSIHRANLEGSGVEDLLTGLDTLTGLTLDLSAGKLCWGTLSGTVERANLDGTAYEKLAAGLSGPRDVEFASVPSANIAPAIGLPAGALNYTEGDGAVVIDSTATASDADSPDFDDGTLTVDFTANGTANDRLAIRDQGPGPGNIQVSGNNISYQPGGPSMLVGTFSGGTDGSTPLVITFNAAADASAVQAVMRNITFENVSEAPNTLPRTVRFLLTDGDGGTSTAATETINVTAANDAPTAVDDIFVVNEDTPTSLDLLANDTDPENDTLTLLGFERVVASYDAGTSGSAVDPASVAGGSWFFEDTEDANAATGSLQSSGVSPDGASGQNAWNLVDGSDAIGENLWYSTTLSGADVALADSNGWSLSAEIRLVDDYDDTRTTFIRYGDGTTRFLAYFDLDANNDLTVELIDDGGNQLITLTNDGGGSTDYHHYEIVYDPDTSMAMFLFDGVRVDGGGWSGEASANEGIRWGMGSGGGQASANYHSIQMSIFDQSITTVNGATVTNNGDGTVNFAPAQNYIGSDSFIYTMRDSDGHVVSANVDVNAG